MRLNHSAKSTGLVITGLLVLGFVAQIEADAGSDGPCIKAGAGVCVPDPACEARERQMRDRPMHDLDERRSIAPRSGTTMDYHYRAPTLDCAPPPPVAPPTGGGRTASISLTAPASRPVQALSRAQPQHPGAQTAKPEDHCEREYNRAARTHLA